MKMDGKLFRYGLAVLGPVASAGSQFLLSLVFLRLLPQKEFGSFSFLLVASILSWGLWSALFCAPLPLLLNQADSAARQRLLKCLFSANLIVAAGAGLIFFGIARALELPIFAAALYAAYGMVALLRWFARAHAYATGHQLRTTLSDIAYSLVLLAGVGLALVRHDIALNMAYATLAVSALVGLLPFGMGYLRGQFLDLSFASVREYGAVWRAHSGWSLLGVLTTEATANSHAYLVTGLFGPAAFAPIAASALMIRPIAVAMNALTDFERAQMARQIGAGKVREAAHAVHFLRAILGLVWAGTGLLVLVLMKTDPHIVFPAHYSLAFLETGAALWMVVAAARLSRVPESALLQAAGQFRPLAMASMISSGVSVVAVLALLFGAGTLWSIVGILLGECVYALWIFRQAARWRRQALTDEAMVDQPA